MFELFVLGVRCVLWCALCVVVCETKWQVSCPIYKEAYLGLEPFTQLATCLKIY